MPPNLLPNFLALIACNGSNLRAQYILGVLVRELYWYFGFCVPSPCGVHDRGLYPLAGKGFNLVVGQMRLELHSIGKGEA